MIRKDALETKAVISSFAGNNKQIMLLNHRVDATRSVRV